MATQLVPENLNVTEARLPAAYEHARSALANCASVDECQTWANKAAALASYARQADDDTLHRTAIRIQSRAVRRCGELLKEIDGRGGDRRPADAGEGVHSKKAGTDLFAPTRTEIAREAGMSSRQQKTAIRVASVPAARFEAAVESDEPPTVTRLADMGRQATARPDDSAAPGFVASIQFAGFARRLAEFAGQHDAPTIAGAVADHNRRDLRRHVAQCRRFLAGVASSLRENRHGL